jgi:hypothetical protein
MVGLLSVGAGEAAHAAWRRGLADMEEPTVKRFLAGSSIPRSILTSEDFSDWHGRLPERAGAWLTMGRLRRRIRLIYADCPGG